MSGLTDKLADIQDKVLYEALPQLPRSLEGVNVSDMNVKYFTKQDQIPILGIQIDATPAVFKQCLRNCKETRPEELNHWKQKVAETFLAKRT